MRPVELTVDGFRSYGSPTTFSWEDRGLVGIVGPIGSGKSSILDAMAYALYAKAPAFERDVKRLINQRRDECHVALTFDVEGRRFQVERAMRRKGAAGHALREVTGGETRLVADRARDLDERIEELLGLDFDAFRRSVLLAQNRFAEFLQATPTQRDAVLEGVVPRFGEIAPMRERAKGLLTLAGARLETVALRRRDLASDREALDVATRRIEELGARLARLEAVAEPLAAADEAVAVARRQEEIARERVEEITELAARVPSREQSEPILETSEQATARLAAAAGAAADARERREGARATLTEALDAVGGREGLTEAATLVERATAAAALADRERRRLEEAETSVERRAHALTEAGSAIERASAAAADAAERRERAEGEARAAEQALHEARHRAMALSLRSELTAGEDCPVCEQAVADLPPAGAAPELEDAEAALTAARAAAADAAEEAMRTSTALARAEEAGDAARSAVDTATAAVREAKDAVEEAEGSRRLALEAVEAALGSGDPAEALAGHRAAVGEADAAVAEAERLVADALEAEERERARTVEATGALEEVRDSLNRLAERLGVDGGFGTDAPALREGLGRIREAWIAGKRAADDALTEATGARERAEKARARVLTDAGLEPDLDLAAARSAAAASLEELEQQAATLRSRLAELEDLEEREADTIGARDRLERLVADLAPSRFLRFVLDEKRRVLAAIGSERLEELSAGRYRFSDDGSFDVVDLMAAEHTRPASSLSGGETFLASLALALALAELVGRDGGRLDAFFLDEGFGSLDPEHLDLAMDGIERLVAGAADRLVVVVSHVPALRERIEDLIVLDKHPATGDTVVTGGARPGEGAA